MAKVYKDPSQKYSDAEIREVCEGCRLLPTYNPENGGSVSSAEMPRIIELMRVDANPMELEYYETFWEIYFDGRVPLKELDKLIRVVHDKSGLVPLMVEAADKDGDGFISKLEFANILKIVTFHDPKMTVMDVKYEVFVKEADTNKDGKVCLEECRVWIENKLKSKN